MIKFFKRVVAETRVSPAIELEKDIYFGVLYGLLALLGYKTGVTWLGILFTVLSLPYLISIPFVFKRYKKKYDS